MSRLGNIPYRKVERALHRLGFKAERQRGSHVWFRHPDGRQTTVPKHPREPIGPGLMRQILRDIRVNADDFLKLL